MPTFLTGPTRVTNWSLASVPASFSPTGGSPYMPCRLPGKLLQVGAQSLANELIRWVIDIVVWNHGPEEGVQMMTGVTTTVVAVLHPRIRVDARSVLVRIPELYHRLVTYVHAATFELLVASILLFVNTAKLIPGGMT